jgi:hypothetical protein
LLGGTATSAVFFAKFCGLDASPAWTTVSMFAGAAEANTSAGAPLVIWVDRPELGPKLNLTVSPGWAASNCFPIVVKLPVSEAAANTVMVPFDDEPPELDELDELEPLLEQPAMANAVRPAAIIVIRRNVDSLVRSRDARSVAAWDLDSDVGGLDGGNPEHPGLQAKLVGGLAAEQ